MAFPTGWGYRQKLTIQNGQVPGTLTDFPVVITRTELHNDVVDPSGSNNAQANGGDVRFSSDSAGTTQLACEVVAFAHDTTTGAGDAVIEIWVDLASISSSVDTDFYIWYNTSGSDTQPAVTDTYGRNAVWANELAVFHLTESPNTDAGGYIDSTGNGYDGTGVSTVLSRVAGPFGADVAQFDGSADYISIPDSMAQRNWTAVSLRYWAKIDSLTADQRGFGIFGSADADRFLGSWMDTGGSGDGWAGQIRDDVDVYSAGENNSDATTSWQRISQDWDGTNLDVRVDGAAPTTVATTAFSSVDLTGDTPTTTIAKLGSVASYLDGGMAFVALRTATMSDDYLDAEYNNQNSPSTFIVDGTPVAVGGATGKSNPMFGPLGGPLAGILG